jgi:hypothetical protein
LDKVTIKNAGDRLKISQSQLQLAHATQDVGHSNNALLENVEKFQAKKIDDVKSILYEIIYSELQYHAKAIEILSNIQSTVFSMDLESDVYEVREKLRDVQSP